MLRRVFLLALSFGLFFVFVLVGVEAFVDPDLDGVSTARSRFFSLMELVEGVP